ncbi:hypothetical protein RhiJN_07986 [Ceratobasidium sp. AG-Ba]|nr:hypothetical protein RhiJN_07986 [Ceratobasidium sp. AG-Ba]
MVNPNNKIEQAGYAHVQERRSSRPPADDKQGVKQSNQEIMSGEDADRGASDNKGSLPQRKRAQLKRFPPDACPLVKKTAAYICLKVAISCPFPELMKPSVDNEDFHLEYWTSNFWEKLHMQLCPGKPRIRLQLPKSRNDLKRPAELLVASDFELQRSNPDHAATATDLTDISGEGENWLSPNLEDNDLRFQHPEPFRSQGVAPLGAGANIVLADLYKLTVKARQSCTQADTLACVTETFGTHFSPLSMSRKRSNSSAPSKASPAVKRMCAQSDAGHVQAAESSADAGSDTELAAGRKHDTIVDEDGSFFHATPIQAEGESESCIKFVDVLPSEMMGSAVQQNDPKPRPKLTIKLSSSSLVSSARIEPKSFADEYEDAEEYEEDYQEGDGGDDEPDMNDVDVDATNVTFAIERDGAHEIIHLPVTITYDLFRFHISETVQSIPNDMRLTYKCPGVKKSELGVHLSSPNNFERLRDRINSDLKKIVAKVKAADKGTGKRAADQRAKAIDDFKSYKITICDLAQQKSNTGGKQSGGSGSKLSAKEDSNASQQRFVEYIKTNRPKCTTCQKNCGIVPLRGQGPTHVPLTEECFELWAKLSVLKKVSPYSLTPPPQVLEVLRVTTEAKNQSKPVSSASSSGHSDKQLVVSSNRGSVQSSVSSANPSSNYGITSVSAAGPSTFSSIPGSVGLGAPQMALNGGMFMGGSNVGLGTGFGLPAQMSQFTSGMNQPSLVMYNPQGMGLGMASPSMVSGFPRVQLDSIGGFPIISLGGMFGGTSGENGSNLQG